MSRRKALLRTKFVFFVIFLENEKKSVKLEMVKFPPKIWRFFFFYVMEYFDPMQLISQGF